MPRRASRQGVDRHLFQFNLDLSKKMDQTGFWLYVWTGNLRAIEFYRKAGFSIIGTTEFKISETGLGSRRPLTSKGC